MDKPTLRKQLRTLRKNISQGERTQKNRDIGQRLEAHPLFQTAKTILFYLSNDEEVDTHVLIQKYLEKKIILVPTMINDQLKPTPLTHWHDLTIGNHNILEVKSEKQHPFHGKIDLIIVPGIGFDLSGHRLGYGKGTYDSYLSHHDTPTIGLSYDCQLINQLPSEPHDIALHGILTESKLITPS